MKIITSLLNKKISKRVVFVITAIATFQILFALVPHWLMPILWLVADYEIWALIEAITVPITTLAIALYVFQKMNIEKQYSEIFILGYIAGIVLGAGFLFLAYKYQNIEPSPLIQKIVAEPMIYLTSLIHPAINISGIYTGIKGFILAQLISLFFIQLVIMPIFLGLALAILKKIWNLCYNT